MREIFLSPEKKRCNISITSSHKNYFIISKVFTHNTFSSSGSINDGAFIITSWARPDFGKA